MKCCRVPYTRKKTQPTPKSAALASFSNTSETLCAGNLTGQCPYGGECVNLHHNLPYLWQGWLDKAGAWVNLLEAGVSLEQAFSQPGTVVCNTQVRDFVKLFFSLEADHSNEVFGLLSFVHQVPTLIWQ